LQACLTIVGREGLGGGSKNKENDERQANSAQTTKIHFCSFLYLGNISRLDFGMMEIKN
jgi:hypothetical protein